MGYGLSGSAGRTRVEMPSAGSRPEDRIHPVAVQATRAEIRGRIEKLITELVPGT